MFVDNLAIVVADAVEAATVVTAADPVTEEGSKPDPVAVNVAVPVAELRTLKYATPSEKLLATKAVVIALELAAFQKPTVEVVEASVIDSPDPRDAVAPVESVSVTLYRAAPVVPVIVDPPVTAAIVAVVGDPLVAAVNVVVVRFAPIAEFVALRNSRAVSKSPFVLPT